MRTQSLSYEKAKQDTTLRNIIAEEIRRRILEGQYKLGQKLSQKELAAEMNTSRGPVQSALTVLCQEGLVQIIPQSGSFIFNPTEEEIHALYEVNNIYEAGALTIVMEHCAHELIARLEATLQQAKGVNACPKEWVKIDRAFHATFIDMAGNAYLLQAYRNFTARTTALVFKNTLSHERMQNSIQEHVDIVAALKRGDVNQAIAFLRKNNTFLR